MTLEQTVNGSHAEEELATDGAASPPPVSIRLGSGPQPFKLGGLPPWALVCVSAGVLFIAILIALWSFGWMDDWCSALCVCMKRSTPTLHVERGVLTCYDLRATERGDCVLHCLLAQAPADALSKGPRLVSAAQCSALRDEARILHGGKLKFVEIDALLESLGCGILLLDLSVPGSPWLGSRNPAKAATFALVLQVTGSHWEPIAHDGTCVLREWDEALSVARLIADVPNLNAHNIPVGGVPKETQTGFPFVYYYPVWTWRQSGTQKEEILYCSPLSEFLAWNVQWLK